MFRIALHHAELRRNVERIGVPHAFVVHFRAEHVHYMWLLYHQRLCATDDEDCIAASEESYLLFPTRQRVRTEDGLSDGPVGHIPFTLAAFGIDRPLADGVVYTNQPERAHADQRDEVHTYPSVSVTRGKLC